MEPTTQRKTTRERFAEHLARAAVQRFRHASYRHFVEVAHQKRWGHVRSVQGAASQEWLNAVVKKMEAPQRRRERQARARERARRLVQDRILNVFADLGDGLRGEEIAAAARIDEDKVWRLLEQMKRDGWLVDKGETGWVRWGSLTDAERSAA